jgi:hypothetical protein
MVEVKFDGMVCAWCDVYCREEVWSPLSSHTVCAYCGRSELRFGKRGRQTPIPKDSEVTPGEPF